MNILGIVTIFFINHNYNTNFYQNIFFDFPQGLVIAGIKDITRPAEQLSIGQTAALAATGLIWSRYSLVIIPKNWNLFSVNIFVATTQVYQFIRTMRFKYGQ